MVNLVLFIIAGIVIYYLYITFQEYLKNPISTQPSQSQSEYNLKNDPYVRADPKDRLKNSYAGVSVRILNKLLEVGIAKDSRDKAPSLLQRGLIESFIKNVSLTLSDKQSEQQLLSMVGQSESQDIASLAQEFLNDTYGEYKKRVAFVAFLFMLAWSDKDLNEREREVIIDVAAYLDIDNQDFNQLYESFESSQSVSNDEITTLKAQYRANFKDMQTASALQEGFTSQIASVIAKSQKSQETPKALIDKLWALQEVYDEVYNEAHNEVCDKAHDDTHQDSTNATNPESNI